MVGGFSDRWSWFLWSVVGYFLGKWSVVPGWWSVVGVTVVGGRCHCGRWSVVGGWSVGGGFVLRRKNSYRQRWQEPDVHAELAKRVICGCIREICFFRDFMGAQKSKNFRGHFWLSIFMKDNLRANGANIISDLSFGFSIVAEALTLVHDLLILSTNCRK